MAEAERVEIGTVVRLGHEGDGIVETPDGLVYVPGALPGEHVARDGRDFTLGPTVSLDRRGAFLCPHFTRCGGCALQHMSDDLYRRWKARLIPDALATHGLAADIRPMIEAPRNSRRRAVLTVRRDGREIVVGFHAPRSHELVAIEQCAVLTPAIVAGLGAVRAMSRFLLTPKGDARVTVIDTPHGLDLAFETPRPDLTPDALRALTAAADSHRLARVSTGGEVLLRRAHPVLAMAGVDVVPPPGAFLQATVETEQALQGLVAAATAKAKRVADLFAGIGTLTFAIARRAQVEAIDSERPLLDALIAAARHAQGLKPVTTRVRDLVRDPLSPRELDAYDAVVFDPPRAGAKEQAVALAKSKVKTIVAVSCNPGTLARDLALLVEGGYRIAHVTPIDQFLFTPHIEAVAVLTRPGKR